MCTDFWQDTAEKIDTRQKKVIGYRFQLYFSHIYFKAKFSKYSYFKKKF